MKAYDYFSVDKIGNRVKPAIRSRAIVWHCISVGGSCPQRRLVQSFLLAIVSLRVVAADAQTLPDADRGALEKTSECIRAAFAVGDVQTIMRYHHPQVNKTLSFNKVLLGHEAVAADLSGVLGPRDLPWCCFISLLTNARILDLCMR